MINLYRFFIGSLFPFYSIYLRWRALRKPAYAPLLRQSLGYDLPRHTEKTVWVHAVSVGEVLAARWLVRDLALSGDRVIVSVTTPTGKETAISRLGDVADIVTFPLDFAWVVKRAVAALNPKLFVTIDTEIWPNLLEELKTSGARIAMVNGRISDRSAPRYAKAAFFFRKVLDNVDLALMQSDEDRRRLVRMGANPERVTVAGNIKFDGMAEPLTPEDRVALRRSLGIAAAEDVLFLGSLHEGEGEAIEAVIRLMANRSTARLVIAPRRIENIEWIEALLEPVGLTIARKSTMIAEPPRDNRVVPVIDTFGELATLYGVADIAFVGGSLINHGGQNPLEPAAHGVPVLFGPSMSNFREAAPALLKAGGAEELSDGAAISARMEALLADDDLRQRMGGAARKVVDENRGVTGRVVARLQELIG